ncbi:MAG: AraC family transcriptional regulator [Haliea sp.]|uniref:helix-turn-helix transcriptional regulator n=1 Tax=Marinobacter salarius TaxID=1420917 RepID=UPI0032EE041B
MVKVDNSEIAPALLVCDRDVLGTKLDDVVNLMRSGVGRVVGDEVGKSGRQSGAFAVALDTSFPRSPGGLRTYLPEHLGNGYWDVVELVPGIYSSITDAHYHRVHRLAHPDETLIKIRVICSGTLLIGTRREAISGGTAHIHSLHPEKANCFSYEIQPGALQMVTLHLLPEALENFGIDIRALHLAIAAANTAGTDANPSQPISVSPLLLRIASDMIQSRDRLPPALRLTYITGKSRELLTEILTSLFYGVPNSDMTGTAARETRLKRRIQEAKRILDSSGATPPTIEQLARMVGVNRTTLKTAFKATYGRTIHQYHAERRMNEARRLIEESALQIGEIAERLGFAQLSQLSTAVKRHFGCSPRELRRRQQEPDLPPPE